MTNQQKEKFIYMRAIAGKSIPFISKETGLSVGELNLNSIGGGTLGGWWRSDLGVGLNGGDVSSWADQSNNGADLVQSTAINQPTYGSSGIGSIPSIRPEEDDHYLSFTTNPGLNLSRNVGAFSFWAVFKSTSAISNSSLFATEDSLGGPRVYFRLFTSGGTGSGNIQSIIQREESTTPFIHRGGTIGTTDYTSLLFIVDFSNDLLYMYQDNVVTVNGQSMGLTGGLTDDTQSQSAGFFERGDACYGHLLEAAAWNDYLLTESDRNAIAEHVSKRYGI